MGRSIGRRYLFTASLFAFAAVLTACTETGGPVTIYMRNDTAKEVFFSIRPVADPLISFGVATDDVGGTCVVAPDNWEFVLVPDGRAPDDVAQLPALQRAPLVVEPQGDRHTIIWAWVDPNGAVSSGVGTPAWWAGPRQEACKGI